MIGAVEQYHLEIDDWKTGKYTRLCGRLQPFLDPWHIFLRHGATDHCVLKDKAGARRQRLEAELDASELAGTAGLLLVRVVDFGRAGDRLAIGDLRRTDIGAHFEFALHTIDDDLEMQLAHSLDHRLAALVVDSDAEGRVFGGEPRQRLAHLLLIALGLGLDRDLDYRIRK